MDTQVFAGLRTAQLSSHPGCTPRDARPGPQQAPGCALHGPMGTRQRTVPWLLLLCPLPSTALLGDRAAAVNSFRISDPRTHGSWPRVRSPGYGPGSDCDHLCDPGQVSSLLSAQFTNMKNGGVITLPCVLHGGWMCPNMVDPSSRVMSLYLR